MQAHSSLLFYHGGGVETGFAVDHPNAFLPCTNFKAAANFFHILTGTGIPLLKIVPYRLFCFAF
jgi:hypothetical protein